MRDLLIELGVTVALIGRQSAPKEKQKIFSVFHNGNEIGRIEVKGGNNTYYPTGYYKRGREYGITSGQHKEFIECVINLLIYHKIYTRTDVTSMANGIMSPNVITKISNIFILHNRDLGDPDTSIHCMCLVTYVNVKSRVWQACTVRRIFALVDLVHDKFLMLNGKELEAGNTREMIGHVRTLIFGEQK